MNQKSQSSLQLSKIVSRNKNITLSDLKKVFPVIPQKIQSHETKAKNQRNRIYEMINKEVKYLQEIKKVINSKQRKNFADTFESTYRRQIRIKTLMNEDEEPRILQKIRDSLEKIKKSERNTIKNSNQWKQDKQYIESKIIKKQFSKHNPEEINSKDIIKQQIRVKTEIFENSYTVITKSESTIKRKKKLQYFNPSKIKTSRKQESKEQKSNELTQQILREKFKIVSKKLNKLLKSDQIEMQVIKQINESNKIYPLQSKQSKKRAEILLQNRWNKTIEKLFKEQNLENFEIDFLKQYFEDPQNKVKINQKIHLSFYQKISDIIKNQSTIKHTVAQIPTLKLNQKSINIRNTFDT